jgi:hypothetical protein
MTEKPAMRTVCASDEPLAEAPQPVRARAAVAPAAPTALMASQPRLRRRVVWGVVLGMSASLPRPGAGVVLS